MTTRAAKRTGKKKGISPIFPIRLSPREKEELLLAARANGMRLGTFLKKAGHAAAVGSLRGLKRKAARQAETPASISIQLDFFPEQLLQVRPDSERIPAEEDAS